MPQSCDASRSLTALEQDSTIIAVIEMSQAKWLVAALVPGVERQPLKKLDADAEAVLKLLRWWRDEAGQVRRQIKRIVVAYEAGRDGFWLARWLRARGVEAYVIHPSSVAVSREHRRAKTDRLDTELLMRVFLGWLRGEKRHCSMAAIPTVEEEDARRPNRERGNLVTEQTRIVNQIKAVLVRFGIRSFRPTPGKVEERLEGLCTAEGMPLPENTRAELRRHFVQAGKRRRKFRFRPQRQGQEGITDRRDWRPPPNVRNLCVSKGQLHQMPQAAKSGSCLLCYNGDSRPPVGARMPTQNCQSGSCRCTGPGLAGLDKAH
jgi:transposase